MKNTTKQNALPSRTWWVDPEKILAGGYPGSTDPIAAEKRVQNFLDLGIRCFINLQEENELGKLNKPFPCYSQIVYKLSENSQVDSSCLRFPIHDFDTANDQTILFIMDTISACIQRKLHIYIHCWGGHGRTAMIVGCWLVSQGFQGKEALAHIRKLRQHDDYLKSRVSPQISSQIDKVLNWQSYFTTQRMIGYFR